MAIEVTQEDRDAAEGLWGILGPWRMGTLEEVAEAFARHRQAAYEQGYKAAHMEMLIKESGDLI